MTKLDLRIPPKSLVQVWTPLGIELTTVWSPTGVATGAPSDIAVTGLTVASVDVLPGMAFLALSGRATHGARFAEQALSLGAAVIVTDLAGARHLAATALPVPVFTVEHLREHLGRMSAAFYGEPATAMTTFGVTGTNGKTTTTWLLEAALVAAGMRPSTFGTVGVHFEGTTLDTIRTTPEAPELQAMLAAVRQLGAHSVAMEISSHALALGRVDGLVVDVAGFTNLGHDHLDFHKTMADYEAAKQRLFTVDHAKRCVVVADSPAGRRVASRASIPVARLLTAESATTTADWTVTSATPRRSAGWDFTVRHFDGENISFGINLPGRFNVDNAALAAAMLLTAGVDTDAIRMGFAGLTGVPGRMEVVDRGQPFLSVVDYAHTTEALRAALNALRTGRDGRLIVVFGCGGDRDASKRPLMGEVAGRLADVVVVTDDNPRSEDPQLIRQGILAGTASTNADVREVGDRADAIALAVSLAQHGDAVLVAGKGHEQGQEVADVMLPFDDRAALANALDAEGTSS